MADATEDRCGNCHTMCPLPRAGAPLLSGYPEGSCHLVQDARRHPQPGPLQPISCSATHPRTPNAASAGAHRSTWTHPPPGNNPKGIQGSASRCRDLKRNTWAYSVGGLVEAGGGGCWRALPQAAQAPPSSLKTPSSLLRGWGGEGGQPKCQSGKELGLCMPVAAQKAAPGCNALLPRIR